MRINTLENGRIIRRVVLESLRGQMDRNIKESFGLINLKGKESVPRLMGRFIKGDGKMVRETAWEK